MAIQKPTEAVPKLTADEIRPQELFAQYLRLSQIDGERLETRSFVSVPCPGCASSEHDLKFKKNGYSYLTCDACGTLYCSPRPSEKQLETFYKDSESSRFWAEVFFPSVAEVRREKLFRPKARRIKELTERLGIAPRSFCDVGAGAGVFLEELRTEFPTATLHAVEPSPEMAKVCREKGIETFVGVSQEAGAWAGRFDFVLSSEVIEHVFSPHDFVRSLSNLLKIGGHGLITGLGYEGFDILTLQQDSASVSPPHHLNFLSAAGFERLFEMAGFDSVLVETPGVLDVDIVLKSDHAPEFLKVLASRGPAALQDLQILLQRYKLSSHVWTVGRRKI